MRSEGRTGKNTAEPSYARRRSRPAVEFLSCFIAPSTWDRPRTRMLFHSYGFLFLFWPLCWLVVTRARRAGPAAAWTSLLLGSWLFYALWRSEPGKPYGLYLPLLLGSTAFNWWCGLRLARTGSGRLLALGVTFNLLLLGVFKYAGFTHDVFAAVVRLEWARPEVVLPIGISFFTFQQIAYLSDCRKDRRAEKRFAPYATFVAFFAQLIAGPIVHAREILPQLREKLFARADARMIVLGLCCFSIGLAKKVLLADSLAGCVQGVFDRELQPTFWDAWVGVFSYSMQLYLDFSGYADMAIGLGLTFGLRLPENFDSPYKATSIVDFWRRWHQTLSQFLRDYLYIPLGGSRRGPVRRYLNLWITMLLGGLWHGAGWTFVLWGALHGFYLTVNHLWREFVGRKTPRVVAWSLCFVAVCVAWVPFRAPDFERAAIVLREWWGSTASVSTDRPSVPTPVTSAGCW